MEGNLNNKVVEPSVRVDLALKVDSKVWNIGMGVSNHVALQPP